MILQVGDLTYVAHFQHVLSQTTYCDFHVGCCLRANGKGPCLVKPPLPYVGMGIASCHEDDQFSKSAGRKVSLARALRIIPRNLRHEIWEAYFKISPHK